jgi:hypothetical protein
MPLYGSKDNKGELRRVRKEKTGRKKGQQSAGSAVARCKLKDAM